MRINPAITYITASRRQYAYNCFSRVGYVSIQSYEQPIIFLYTLPRFGYHIHNSKPCFHTLLHFIYVPRFGVKHVWKPADESSSDEDSQPIQLDASQANPV